MSEAASNEIVKQEEEILPMFMEPMKLKVRGPKGDVTTYYVHETSGPEDFWKWQVKSDALAKESKEDKVPTYSFYQHQVDLLALCIRDAQGDLVPKSTIMNWGLSLKDHAFKLAQKMNGMNKEEAEKVGKESTNEATSGAGTKSPNESAAP